MEWDRFEDRSATGCDRITAISYNFLIRGNYKKVMEKVQDVVASGRRVAKLLATVAYCT